MHVAALLAVLPLAAASISFNGNVGPKLAFNSPVTLKWTTNAKPAKVFLVSGTEDANNIYALYDVVCDVWITNKLDQACTSDQNEVTWTPKDVPVGTYSFMALANDGSRGFSNFVSIDQGSGPTSSASSAATSATTTAPSTSGTTTGSPSSTSTDPSSSQTNPAGQNSGSSDDNTGGLSTGAKAGVGVGAAIGGILVLGLLGFLFFRMGKKAAANKSKKKDDGAQGEEGDVSTEGEGKAAATAAAARKADGKDDDEKEDLEPAEMPAPNIVHEAPDYKLRLDSPGANQFFSELDATGGSFVLPSSRPSTSAGLGGAADGTASPSGTDRPNTPRITVTSPEGENTDGATDAVASPKETSAGISETSGAPAADATSGSPAAEEKPAAATETESGPHEEAEAPAPTTKTAETSSATPVAQGSSYEGPEDIKGETK